MEQLTEAPTKFYQEDIVQRRCWHDAEDLPPHADQYDPLMRPLERGEVGVSWFPLGTREILPESDLMLMDRLFQPGDLCKKSIDDVRSGVVTQVVVEGRLQHCISGEPVQAWMGMHDVASPLECEIGDYVVYDNWIGQLFDEMVVDTATGLVRLPELSSRLTIGDKGNDIIPPPMGMSALLGLFRQARNDHEDVVVSIKHTVVAVSWLAINQSLPPEAAQNAVRPGRFWSGRDLSKLKLVRSRAEQMMRVGDKVTLKNTLCHPETRHGKASDTGGEIVVRAYVVEETHTTVQVLWQDGTPEVLSTKKLIPYLNPDEYDCWPGDHVIWKGEDSKRPAVVQSVDAVERTAEIRYSDTGTTELASVLELDPHGTSDWSALAPAMFDGLGVRRGDFVFIHKNGSNGLESPRVPRIGEVEPWVREPPVVHDNGEYGGWRQQMYEIGMSIARRQEFDVYEGAVQKVSKDDKTLDWFGEVLDLHLDGMVQVGFPNGDVQEFPLNQLTRLYDTLEQLEDILDDGMSAIEEMDEEDADQEETWTQDENGVWHAHAHDDDGDEWEETDEDGEDAMNVDPWETADIQPPTTHDINLDDGAEWGDVNVSPVKSTSPSLPPIISPESSSTAPSSSPAEPDDMVLEKEITNGDVPDRSELSPSVDPESPWKRFEVLSGAPLDHAFYNTAPSQPSRNFLSRLQKEYRALQSSLPDTIVVRAYEDRTDLIRSLIIGPENTPYEDAPFVIDWMLGHDFPQSPPVAHFLSWTNGNGRGANLYEEGKVCLSILGTWAGDKNESWSPARSSLLQALVSIQGLVLVKEPWFCEPAYDKLRGTEEGIVNSRLYNEKAYVLSRGFVRRALEIPLGSLETEITWLYHKKGKLAKVLQDARALIEKSRASHASAGSTVPEEDRERAIPRLTGGGIITLERTLAKLEALTKAGPSVAS
ncbi:hypothetical protein OF83DRAFT_1275465 [Amylostereum chailletii]|nr:hypothetical protein OF83DRAFT_1275465 [Amylostereum chailletii]